MKYRYGKRSLEVRETIHPDLQTLFDCVLESFDHSLIEGFRDQEKQDKAFREGKSKLVWPNGKHNGIPSLAVDVAPYPIDWNDRKRFIYFSGFVMGVADRLYQEGKIKHKIRWGGDWNGNNQLKDNRFDDLVHFELIV